MNLHSRGNINLYVFLDTKTKTVAIVNCFLTCNAVCHLTWLVRRTSNVCMMQIGGYRMHFGL
jgi:hypothetical protein